MLAGSVFVLLSLLLAVPFLTGLVFTTILPQEKSTPAVLFTAGFLAQIACFEVIAVICMLTDIWNPFARVRILYTACALLFCVAGAFVYARKKRSGEAVLHVIRPASDKETAVWYGIFFLLVLFQMGMSLYLTSFDGDDTYYVAQSLNTQMTGRMYTIEPYTGHTTPLDSRHALALITVWQAYLAKLSGIHATILAHSVMPLFLIPFSYLVLYLVGRELFAGNETRVPLFLGLTCLLRIFGNVSIYTPETFLLTRTWQGKSILANVVPVFILWIFLQLFRDPGQKGLWILLALTNVFAGTCTSIGTFLSALLVALFTAALAVYKKSPRTAVYGALTLIPNAVYVALYLVLLRMGE